MDKETGEGAEGEGGGAASGRLGSKSGTGGAGSEGRAGRPGSEVGVGRPGSKGGAGRAGSKGGGRWAGLGIVMDRVGGKGDNVEVGGTVDRTGATSSPPADEATTCTVLSTLVPNMTASGKGFRSKLDGT